MSVLTLSCMPQITFYVISMLDVNLGEHHKVTKMLRYYANATGNKQYKAYLK